MTSNSYDVAYSYKLDRFSPHAPLSRQRSFTTQQEAERYAETVKAHALANPDVWSVHLCIQAPLPEWVYVNPDGYMPKPVIREWFVRHDKNGNKVVMS